MMESRIIGYTFEPVNDIAFNETCKGKERTCAGCGTKRIISDFEHITCLCGSRKFVSYFEQKLIEELNQEDND